MKTHVEKCIIDGEEYSQCGLKFNPETMLNFLPPSVAWGQICVCRSIGESALHLCAICRQALQTIKGEDLL